MHRIYHFRRQTIPAALEEYPSYAYAISCLVFWPVVAEINEKLHIRKQRYIKQFLKKNDMLNSLKIVFS